MAVLCAFGLLAGQLGAQDAKARRREARELARQGAAAINRLAELVTDPDLEVRIEAVKSLTEIGTARSLEPLIKAVRDNDPEVQIRATDGLVNFYLPGYVRSGLSATLRRAGGRITSRFTDGNDQVIEPFVEVRPEVIQALGWLARSGASMEARANAARAIGILRGRAAVADLLEAVRSKDTRVIYESLIAFQKIRDRSVGPRLTFLLRDLDEQVQVTAIETAGLLFNLEALPTLRDVLGRTSSRRVRRAALSAIAMLPDESNRAVLLNYLNDRDAQLRAAAYEGLGRIKNPSDLPALKKAFEGESDNLARLSAAFALVMLGNLELGQHSPFQYLFDNLNSAARARAAQALLIEAARAPEIRKMLYPLLPGATRAEKIGLARVLAESGDAESVQYLEPLTRDANTEVAEQAIRALRNLRARLP